MEHVFRLQISGKCPRTSSSCQGSINHFYKATKYSEVEITYVHIYILIFVADFIVLYAYYVPLSSSSGSISYQCNYKYITLNTLYVQEIQSYFLDIEKF